MKQNTLFDYLKKTIKSDVKDPNNKPTTVTSSHPTPDKKLFQNTSNINEKSSSKLQSKEEKDLQKAIEESLKVSNKVSSPAKNSKILKRLKKGSDIDPVDQPIKLPPKQSLKKKAGFLEPDPEPLTEEQAQIEIEKVIGELSKQEVEFNLERFKFTKSEKEPKKTIEDLFKQRQPKTPQPKESMNSSIGKKKIEYKIDEEVPEKPDDKTEVLTEELLSDPGEDYFDQFNKKQGNIPLSAPKKNITPSRNLQESQKKQTTNQIPPYKSIFTNQNIVNKPVNKPVVEKTFEKTFNKANPSQKNKSITPEKKSLTSNSTNKPKSDSKSKSPTPIPSITGPLNKLTFVITGLLDTVDRDTLMDIIKAEGGKVTGNVSGRTDYLIVGSKLEDGRPAETSSKYRKALENKTKILNESQFDDLLFNKTGKKLVDCMLEAQKKSLATLVTATTTNNPPVVNKPIIAQNPNKGFQSYLKTDATKEKTPVVTPDKTFIPSNERHSYELWTHKYAPKDLTHLIGNNDNIKKIIDWLNNWNDVVLNGKKTSQKPKAGNWANATNINARACLISGPPGIGKTTSIRVLSKQLGYELIEKNASDVRNKASINTLLGDLTSNNLITWGTAKVQRKFMILMDEVDGMSGSDRGGSQALIEIIKSTKVPIICICNDRQNPKIRSLCNHCYDIKFHKPQKQIIARRVAEICGKENLGIDLNGLELLCESLGNDIRQILNVLELMKKRSKEVKFYDMKNRIHDFKKDDTVMLSNFDAATKFLNRNEHRKNTMREKLDLFFIDYDLIPLLIQENYLTACPRDINLEILAKSSELVAFGDVISNCIRRNNEWGLMPNLAFASTIYPTFLSSNLIPFPKFPEFLGKNSSQRKTVREIKELKVALGPVISGDRTSVKFEYSEGLLNLILFNLTNTDSNGVQIALEVMEEYGITPELLKENLLDVQFNPKKLDLLHEISTQTKSSLTKLYNKLHKDTFKGKKGKKGHMTVEEVEGMKDPMYEEVGKVEPSEEEGQDEDDGNDNGNGNDNGTAMELESEDNERNTKAKTVKKMTEKKTVGEKKGTVMSHPYFEDFEDEIDTLLNDKPQNKHPSKPSINHEKEPSYEEFVEEVVSDHFEEPIQQKLAPTKDLKVKSLDPLPKLKPHNDDIDEYYDNDFESLEENNEQSPKNDKKMSQNGNLKDNFNYYREKTPKTPKYYEKTTTNKLPEISKSQPTLSHATSPQRKPSIMDLKSKFNAILKHHISSPSRENPFEIVKENQLLVKLIQDFNGIVTHELDKALPKIQHKTDFLHPETNINKTLEYDIINNSKILKNLREEYDILKLRKIEISQRNYLFSLKNQLENLYLKKKNLEKELHQISLEIQQEGKKLNYIENDCFGIPENLTKCQGVEEELALNEQKFNLTKEKQGEILRYSQEITKKEGEIQERLEKTVMEAEKMGISLEKEVLERDYMVYKRKIGNISKDLDVLRRRNEKMEEIWKKELEDIKKVIEIREKKTLEFDKGLKLESEIIDDLLKKDEIDEDLYKKIEELSVFGGGELLGKKLKGVNMSFIEETKKKLGINSSFISNREETKKTKIYEKKQLLVLQEKEKGEEIKEEEESTKKDILDHQSFVKSSHFKQENSKTSEKNFIKSLNDNEKNTNSEKIIENIKIKEENTESNSMKTFNFGGKSSNKGVMNNFSLDDDKKNGDSGIKMMINDNKIVDSEEKKENENNIKTFNFGDKPKNKPFFNNLNEKIIEKPIFTDKIEKDVEIDIKKETNTENIPIDETKNLKTFNFSKGKRIETFEKDTRNENITIVPSLKSINFNKTNDDPIITKENLKENIKETPKEIIIDKSIINPFNKPTQTKKLRNIFNDPYELEEKKEKIIEIPEITELKENNQEKRPSWLESSKLENIKTDANINKKEGINGLNNNNSENKSFKKKIQDPFEKNDINEEVYFGFKKELTEKKPGLDKKKSDLSNINNDFFKDFDL